MSLADLEQSKNLTTAVKVSDQLSDLGSGATPLQLVVVDTQVET